MIVCGGTRGDGRELVIVGLDHDNLDRLRAGKPTQSDVPGLPHVFIHAAPTLRGVVEEFVRNNLLPQSALDEWEEPDPDAAKVWTAGEGTRTVPAASDDAGSKDDLTVRGARPCCGTVPGEPHTGGCEADWRSTRDFQITPRGAAVEAVLDVLAPRHGDERIPVFEWGHETTPTGDDMRQLADELVGAVLETVGRTVDVVFDGPPGAVAGRFVEVEDVAGRSVRAGEWIDRGNGMWALRLTELLGG